MQRTELFSSINRRQLLGYFGVSVAIAVPTLTRASQTPIVSQTEGQEQSAPSVKKIVVSF